MRQFMSSRPFRLHFQSFSFLLLTLFSVFEIANAAPIDDLLVQIDQLKSETQAAISDTKTRKKLVRKVKSSKKHARKSKRFSTQGKDNKATNQLRFVWNNIYSYRSSLYSAQQDGKISTLVLTNLEQKSLAILDAVTPMGKNIVLQQLSKLKTDTTQTISHKKTRKKLKKKLKSALDDAKKGIKQSNRGKEQKSRQQFIKARNKVDAYVSELEQVVTQGKVSNDTALPLLQQAAQIKAELTVYIDGNQTPIANAGANQTIEGLTLVSLDGSTSTDSDGAIISYNWMQVEGTNVVLADEDTVSTNFTAPDVITPEVLVFQLAVIDDKGATGITTIEITVNPIVITNLPPVANAGNDQVVEENTQVVLDGSGSTDSDGNIAGYQWSQTTGTTVMLSDPAVVSPSFNAPEISEAETLKFLLTVTDDKGATSTDSITITINPAPNIAPVANAGNDQIVEENTQVVLNGNGSTDSDGNITTYLWAQTGGTPVVLSDITTPSPSFDAPIATTAETLQFQLTVTDNEGATNTDDVTITINPSEVNAAPIAIAGNDQSTIENALVTLDGSASKDTDGNITRYQWTQKTGSAITLSDATIASPTFNAPQVSDTETLTMQLEVTDNDGATSTDTITITLENDLDNDGIPDSTDPDRDGDGVNNEEDYFPDDKDASTVPTVKILTPNTLITVGSSPITVTGTINDATARLTINGVEVSHNNGQFSADVALKEGLNSIVARGIDAKNHEGLATITVSLDKTPPYVTVQSPEDQQTVYTDTISVGGLVNDIVRGAVTETDTIVRVNGQLATVTNRSYLAENIQLIEGENTIEVIASDAVGNVGNKIITVTYEVQTNKVISLVSGQSQAEVINATLTEPLNVKLTSAGTPVTDKTVIFRVVEGDGLLQPNTEDEANGAIVKTDTNGEASVSFKIGSRAGNGNHRVRARAVGFEGEIIFHASATYGEGNKAGVIAGNNQRGSVRQPLPQPFVLAVTDEGANLIPDADIEFKVTMGDGKFQNEEKTYLTKTDKDGRASAHFTLGTKEGLDQQRVTATLVGTNATTGFTASAFVPGDPGQTSVVGVVLDNQDTPLPAVTIRVDGTTRQSVTDSQGQFKITEVPVGPVHLLVEGSTTSRVGEWPTLSYNIVTVPGVENPLASPIYLVELDTETAMTVGAEDTEYTLPDMPGFKLKIKAGSVTFPDGSKTGKISVTPVNANKIPMPPPNGMQPQFIVTIQPHGAKFDPPAELTLPNVDGHLPGAEVEMYSYDHDLEEFVTIGLGTVSKDASIITSNTGVGVIKAGWHCGSQAGGSGCCEGGGGGAPDCGECLVVESSGNCPVIYSCNQPSNPDSIVLSSQIAGNCQTETCGNPQPNSSDKPEDNVACKKPVCNGVTAGYEVDDDHNTPDDACKYCSEGNEKDAEIRELAIAVNGSTINDMTYLINDEIIFNVGQSEESCPNSTFSWELGDGNTEGDTSRVTHQYTESGTYIVKLSATCNGCPASKKTVAVEINVIKPDVLFKESPNQQYEFDNYTNRLNPFKAMEVSKSDSVIAEIQAEEEQVTLQQFLYQSENNDLQVTPAVPSSIRQLLTLQSGVSESEIKVVATVNSREVNNLTVKTYTEKVISVVLIPVYEKANGGIYDNGSDIGFRLNDSVNLDQISERIKEIYKKAVIEVSIEIEQPCIAEFDVNNDGKFNFPGDPLFEEIDIINNKCADPTSNAVSPPLYAYIIPNSDVSTRAGFADFDNKYIFAIANVGLDIGDIVAHEIGHARFFGNGHVMGDVHNLMAPEPFGLNTRTDRLRVDQWDRIHSDQEDGNE